MKSKIKSLNRYEEQLKADIERLMFDNKVKFSVFLKTLRPEIPDKKSSDEYKNIHRAEYLKQLRASYSVLEVKKMLQVLGYKLQFTHNNEELIPSYKELANDLKLKYTELMAVCKLLDIKIEWVKVPMEGAGQD